MKPSVHTRSLLAALHVVLCVSASAQPITFTSATVSIGNADDAPDCLAVADFNGDGSLDLVSANYGLRWGEPGTPGGWNNNLTLLRNTGNGQFVFDTKITVGKGPRGVVAADLDADGKPDIAVVNETDGTLTLLRNTGAGLTEQATIPIGAMPYSVLPVDVDGNGTLDLVGTKGVSHTLWILINDGVWGFTAATSLPTGNEPLSVAAPDINGDGFPDLATANNESGSVSLFLNNGSGGFSSHSTLPLGALAAKPDHVVAADLNTDGKDDLVTVNWGLATMTVFLNNGSGGFSSQTLPAPSYPSSVAAADLNGDGSLDLACGGTGSHVVQLAINDGNGAFTSAGTLTTGRIPNVFAGDFNHDGRPDLACPNFQDGTVTVLLNSTVFPAAGTTPTLTVATVGHLVRLSWPSNAPGWSLQESGNLMPAAWSPGGHLGWTIGDDGTNKSLTMPRTVPSKFFRLLHP